MARYTFDAYYPDGSPRRFAGMFRPPLSECDVDAALGPRSALQPRRLDEPRLLHQSGAFDRPLYDLDPDEVEAAGAKPAAPPDDPSNRSC